MAISSQVIGTRFGPYEVQALLGSGGMASVYRGFDHNLQRPVAIKILTEATASQPELVDRFRQEARLIARLRHPHIVQVYDFGAQAGWVYMVQELLAGPTLADRLAELRARGQPMPRIEVLANLRQLASALDAAHAAGIVHRDVKPANAIWNASGELVLTDFGIAKSLADNTSLTQAGMVLGTPCYVSPEQGRGEQPTPASDIYALGVVLYELIAGRPPFDEPTAIGTVFKHLHEPPPPLMPLRASVTPALEQVVLRALAKQPADRFSSASALASALEQAWPAPAPAAVGPAGARGDIHSQPTTAWQAAPLPEPPAQTAPLPEPPAQAASPISPPPVTQPGPTRARLSPIIVVGTLVLLAALAFALRAQLAAGPPAAVPAAPTSTQAAPTSPQAADAIGQLRELLSGAPSVGVARLDTAEQALAAGDRARATAALVLLQQDILQARRSGTISAEVMRAGLGGIQAVAAQHELELPLQVQ